MSKPRSAASHAAPVRLTKSAELGPPRWRGQPHRLEVWYATFTDPRTTDGYQFLVLRPERVLAWRESDEIAGRTIMRDGEWLV